MLVMASANRKKKLDPTRSDVLLAARLKTGAGKHGGDDRTRNRRDRQATGRDLRSLRGRVSDTGH